MQLKSKTVTCASCKYFNSCTSSKNGRTIQRWEYENVLDDVYCFFRIQYFCTLSHKKYSTENNHAFRIGDFFVCCIICLVSNHHFKWWFIFAPPKGHCYCSPRRAMSQALLNDLFHLLCISGCLSYIMRVLFPLRYPINSDTLSFGGIATLKCT